MEFELYNKEDYIDKLAIREFLKTLSYPLYFLDFETFEIFLLVNVVIFEFLKLTKI